MSELISVIIPAYNAEKYLSAAVSSILSQGYAGLEILVVDDGSEDGTAALAGTFGPPVRSLTQPHTGAASARNLGLSAARGSLIAFLDADDLWSPDKLSLQVAALSAHPEIDVVFGYARNFLEPETPGAEPLWREVLPAHVPGAMLMRRAALDRVGGFSNEMSIGDTIDFYIRAREQALSELVLPDVVLYRRIHGQNLSVRQRDAKGDVLLRILKSSLDRKRGRSAS
jgi:glycosyltransferase involved in cell wall biosynthesis